MLFFCLIRCHAVNVSDNAAYFYNKINEDLKTGGLDVQAEDIIDIIDGYKGRGYALSTQEELGGYKVKIDCVLLVNHDQQNLKAPKESLPNQKLENYSFYYTKVSI